MPSPEPNKEMEDLLKAYAAHRREQARQALPSELHPASRAILQNEVRRAFDPAKPAARSAKTSSWLAAYWPRLALGGGLAAMMLLVVVTSRPPTVPKPSVAPAAGSPTLQSPAVMARFKSAGQQFVQVNNAAQMQNAQSAAAKILATFQVERRGRDVFVIDGDGSIYRGNVIQPVAAKDDLTKSPTAAYGSAYEGGKMRDLEDTASYSFEVSGLNNDLKQNVTFTGNVAETPAPEIVAGSSASVLSASAQAPNSPALDKQAPSGAAVRAVTAQAGPLQAPSNQAKRAVQNQVQQSLRVTGTVKVEGGGEFQIEAQPPGR